MDLLAALLIGVAIGGGAVLIVRGRRASERAAVSAATDGTDDRGVEDELRRAYLRPLVDALPLGVQVRDADGRQLFENERAERLAANRIHWAILGPVVDDLLAEGGRSGEQAHRTVELFGPPRLHVEVSAAWVLVDGVRSAAVLTFENVTSVHRTDALRRDFVANVSHELKTPIGAIGVLAETLIGETDPAVVARLGARLQGETIRLGATVDDLLVLARMESGETFAAEPVRVDDVVATVVDRFAVTIEQEQIDLAVEIVPDDLRIAADRTQLVSTLANLVDNAIKYSEPGSRVGIRAHCTADAVEVSVDDEGIGIPEADLERIFERFYRVDRGRSRDTGGTGLGLSIVRHAMLNHDAEVSVESTEGIGSTFTITFPLPQGATTEPEHASGGRPVDVG